MRAQRRRPARRPGRPQGPEAVARAAEICSNDRVIALPLPEPLALSLQILELSHMLKEGSAPQGSLPGVVHKVLTRLEKAGIDWVLVGAGAVNFYSPKPRATRDVDILVAERSFPQAVSLAREALGRRVRVDDRGTHVVLSTPRSPLEIDLIRSGQHALFETALKERRKVKGVRIPKIEALLALKYLSAISPYRSLDDKHQDIADFVRTWKFHRDRVDRPHLIDLGGLAHDRGQAELARFIDDIEHDRPIIL